LLLFVFLDKSLTQHERAADGAGMNTSVPDETVRRLALQLLAAERGEHGGAESNVAAAARVCEALRRPLCTLAGATGYRELLKRALVLARRQVPSLSAVNFNTDGSLHGLTDLLVDQHREAEVVLISELLGLLVVLIGKDLTVRILLDVWPGSDKMIAETTGDGGHDPTG
jgi:hypothetical protein